MKCEALHQIELNDDIQNIECERINDSSEPLDHPSALLHCSEAKHVVPLWVGKDFCFDRSQ